MNDVRGGLPVCDDTVLEPRVIVWCTGFTPDYRWIDLPIFGEDGYPRHERGVVTEAPGLFFVGLRFQHRLSSSLIGGVGDDARIHRRAGRAAVRGACACLTLASDPQLRDEVQLRNANTRRP